MEWKNKGHEFDDIAKKLIGLFHIRKQRIYIFGAGRLGKELKAVLKKYNVTPAFIDNDKEKQKACVEESEVISLDEYVQKRKKGIIILAADIKNISDMEEQLHKMNLRKGMDYFTIKDFLENVFPILSVYEFNLLFVDLAQICLTEKCSLKCKKCAHGCYAANVEGQDMSMETVQKSVDCFFEKVDIIREFSLIGGEPFLYKELADAIQYIGENYRDKIAIFSVTTNGTIIPQENVLKLCKEYNVLIRISNYSAAIQQLKNRYQQLQERLDENKVSYILGDSDHLWMDYGFETVDRNWLEKDLKQVFDKCRTPCREIRGNKYYYCVMARSVSDNLKLGLGKEDYFDLDKLGENDKKILLEFQMGYSDKGYLDMCNYCNGADAKNYPIPAAEQL